MGNHTFSHPDMSGISSLDTFREELVKVEDLYREVTGEEMPRYYRPQEASYSTENLSMAKELGYHTFFWSLAYVDWLQEEQPTHEEAFEKLLGRIHPGAISSAPQHLPHQRGNSRRAADTLGRNGLYVRFPEGFYRRIRAELLRPLPPEKIFLCIDKSSVGKDNKDIFIVRLSTEL